MRDLRSAQLFYAATCLFIHIFTVFVNAENRCLKGKDSPVYMTPVEPGSLMQVITRNYLPPALAPYPLLEESDVVQPPLPEVTPSPPASSTSGGSAAPSPTAPSGQPKIAICIFLSVLAVSLVTILLL